MRESKKKFYIIRNGIKVGESWAVSANKAISNYWWKYDKHCDPYFYTERSVSDYDAVEA